tara:strand:+ start:203 stop:535 length:333 start_codon:yes stop_codon:yes gene_type:complete
MANTFKLKTETGGSTGANTDLLIYTVPSSTTTVVIGCTIANTTASSITVDAKLENNDGDNIHIGKDLPIPTGSSLDILAGKIVMETADVLKVQSDTANSFDVALSIMEQT